jgi:hypothetical protein
MDFITNNSMILILSAINYIKMVLFGKLSIAVIIIIMLEILLKRWLLLQISVIVIPTETVDSLIRLCKCGNPTIIPHLHRY